MKRRKIKPASEEIYRMRREGVKLRASTWSKNRRNKSRQEVKKDLRKGEE